jgi:hypothetical protein
LTLTALHHPAKGTRSAPTGWWCTSCAVMYLGPMRTAWGDKRLDANCCLYVGVQPLIPPGRVTGQHHRAEVPVPRGRHEVGPCGRVARAISCIMRASR